MKKPLIRDEIEQLWQFVMAADDVWAWLTLNGDIIGLPTKLIHKYETMRKRIMSSFTPVNLASKRSSCRKRFSLCLDCDEHNGCQRYHQHRLGR